MRTLPFFFCVLLILSTTASGLPSAFGESPEQNNSRELEEKNARDKKAFLEGLKAAEAAALKNPEDKAAQAALWQSLMGTAWFLDETGSHREALNYSNRALDIGQKLKDPFMTGRALAWLGWAYSGLGLYDTAQRFYSEALEVGAPRGVPKIIPVWGLSKQELGYLFFKMGDLTNAKAFLNETTSYARENGVLIGVAEGGVRLAEIALHEGDFGGAFIAAREAQDAAEKCHCTPFTLAHAFTVLAQVEVEKAVRDPSRLTAAKIAVDRSMKEATRLGISRFVAQSKLLQARLLPTDKFEQRYELSRTAFETLANMESEMRGDAEISVGKLFLEKESTDYAKFYLEHGVEVNEGMLRKFNKAYVMQDLAQLDGMRGDRQLMLKKLQDSVDRALETGALPIAATSQEQLFRELSQLGYTREAAKWGQDSLATYDKLIAAERDETSRAALSQKRLALVEELGLETLKIISLQVSQPE